MEDANDGSGRLKGGAGKGVQMKVLATVEGRRMTLSPNDNMEFVVTRVERNNKRPADSTLVIVSSSREVVLSVFIGVAILAAAPILIESNPLQTQLFKQVAKPLLLSTGQVQSVSSDQVERKHRNRLQQPLSISNQTTTNVTEFEINLGRQNSEMSFSQSQIRKRPTITTTITTITAATSPTSGPKRFKASVLRLSSSDKHQHELLNNMESTRVGATNSTDFTSRFQQGPSTVNERHDINNNNGPVVSAASNNDINNNTIQASSEPQPQPAWNRNVNSVNGTIDLSLYGHSDVDRLYGDALLVYFRDFNSTLPARRNSTAPIYRSNSRRLPK